jgi:DNA-binding winged helix-turn-helix (wHTH) protein
VVQFGAVEVDEELREVRVGGSTQRVEPQVFAVLVHLIANRHRVVTKEELLDEVWGTRHDSDGAVTSRIKSARQAIGDTGRDQALIRTVHGRGYRFIAEVDDGVAHDGDGDDTGAAPSPSEPPGLVAPAGRSTDERWPLTGRDAELAQALALAAHDGGGGLLLTGPAGLGKSRLARAVLEALADRSVAVARIGGHASATSVPLAALAHLLPNDIADLSGIQGELARAVLLQRARSAIAELTGGRRLVLMVDDADRVDGLSLALIASMMSSGSVFALMTQRIEEDEPLVLEHLVRSGELRHLRLPPVPPDQLTALLGRVLNGPVYPQSAQALVSAAAGNPGLLRQLVEASTASGSLVLSAGLWRLVGPRAVPSDLGAAIRARLDALDPDQRSALELLALAGDLDLDLAFELVDDAVLDQLEFDGLIVVRDLAQGSRVELAHPLYGEIVLATLPSLRARRHRAILEQSLVDRAATGTADRLLYVRLQLEGGSDVDDEMLLESAGLAFAQDRTGLALRLLDRVPEGRRTGRHELLRGEALYMRGRFDEAGATWQGIDLDQLDDLSAAVAIRRITTWQFHAKWRHTEALEALRSQLERFDGDTFRELESYWVELAALDGRMAAEAIERAERSIPDALPHALTTYLSGAAMARFLHGEHHAALALLATRRRLDRLEARLHRRAGGAFRRGGAARADPRPRRL